MTTIITYAVDSKGNRKEVIGEDKPDKEHKAYFHAAKSGILPKGVTRIELWKRIRYTVGLESKPEAKA